jgi:hypothetical protein
MSKGTSFSVGFLTHSSNRFLGDQGGAILAKFALMLPAFISRAALAVDMSYAMIVRQKLRVTASSSALTRVAELVYEDSVAFGCRVGIAAIEDRSVPQEHRTPRRDPPMHFLSQDRRYSHSWSICTGVGHTPSQVSVEGC